MNSEISMIYCTLHCIVDHAIRKQTIDFPECKDFNVLLNNLKTEIKNPHKDVNSRILKIICNMRNELNKLDENACIDPSVVKQLNRLLNKLEAEIRKEYWK